MEQDGLATLAEIFIGLAGFTGIALALKSNPKPYYLMRVVLIVSFSIVSIVVGLMPIPLIEAGFKEETIWRIGSGIVSASYFVAFPFQISYRRKAGADEKVNWVIAVLMTSAIVIGLIHFANAVGLFGELAFSVMFFGLLATFVQCGALFIILITFGRLESD